MEDIHDIAPPIFPHLSYLPFYALAGLLIGAFVFALLYVIYRKRARRARRAAIIVEDPPPLPIDYKALAQLRLQKARKFMEASRFDEYFLEVSSIVKEYLSGVHNVHAQEMTSFELLKTFSTISQLPLFFELCYRYEFAGVEAQRQDAETVFSLALEVVGKDS